MKSCLFCKHAEFVEADIVHYSTLTGDEFWPPFLRCNAFGKGIFGKRGFSISIENTEDLCNVFELVKRAESCAKYEIRKELL